MGYHLRVMTLAQDGIHKVAFERRVTCPLHQEQPGLLPVARVHDPLTGRDLRILTCAACGVGLTDPFPTPDTVGALYQGRGSAANFDPIRGTIIDRLKDLSARRDLLNITAPRSAESIQGVLDYGTGNGRFALASREVFPDCEVDAVDFDLSPPPSLATEGIRYLTDAAFRAETRRYDLILLRHVLEHLHDPIAFLSLLRERLAPDGLIYVEVPNLRSANIRLFGTIANAYQVPYHLFHFASASLDCALAASGLTAAITQKEMPLAGGTLATLLHQQRGFPHQLAGVFLHPAQLTLDALYGKPCLSAVARERPI
jgi:SAM-dependent methyltransferase